MDDAPLPDVVVAPVLVDWVAELSPEPAEACEKDSDVVVATVAEPPPLSKPVVVGLEPSDVLLSSLLLLLSDESVEEKEIALLVELAASRNEEVLIAAMPVSERRLGKSEPTWCHLRAETKAEVVASTRTNRRNDMLKGVTI